MLVGIMEVDFQLITMYILFIILREQYQRKAFHLLLLHPHQKYSPGKSKISKSEIEAICGDAIDFFYADYFKSYIERDVRDLSQIADEDSFFRFMTACAAMSGQLLNMASLADAVGASVPTVKRWLSVLKTSGIIFL